MLVDRYQAEDVFARVPQMAERIDPVLKELDQLLDDDALYQQVRADFGKRYCYTMVHGRHSTPVEVLLRMLLVKHLHQWSYQDTEEQVDQNLILRWFCRLYWASVPDDTTLIRWANTLQPETLHALNDRVVQLAVQAKVTKGRKLRLDATCVQTEIHHPTDSGLLVDSVRVRLPLRAAGQRVDQRSGAQRAAGLSLTAAHGAAGGPNPASAVAAQRRRKRGRAEGTVSAADPDGRADGAAKQACRRGPGQADPAAGEASARARPGPAAPGGAGHHPDAHPCAGGLISGLGPESAQPL
jgi:IS5 family transposase